MRAFGIRVVAAAVLGAGTVVGIASPPDRAEATRCVVAGAPGCVRTETSRPGPLRSPEAVLARAGSAVPDAAVPKTHAAAMAAAHLATSALADVCGPPFVKGDIRLGPAVLPNAGYFGFLLRRYLPYGGLTPWQFLARYWNQTVTPNAYRFPPDLGFAHSGNFPNGRPLSIRGGLPVGLLVDRFGGPGGGFLAPGGTAYGERSLPPTSLNTNPADPAHLCNYHLYAVTRRFDVDAGPIASAFQQPGLGLQYVLNSAYVPGAPTPLTVQFLLDNGYLTTIY